MNELTLQAQTTFAELVERTQAREAARAVSSLRGFFAKKQVKGREYWYFKTSVPGKGQVEIYLGAASAALERIMAAHKEGRLAQHEEEESIRELVAMLRAGGASLLDRRSGEVVRSLGDAGVFRMGGVLVGTQAFVVLGNVLGVRWRSGARTEDIDIATEIELPIALSSAMANDAATDVPSALAGLEMGFLPIPGLDPRQPSTSFKVRGRGLRVDLLTPLRGADRAAPVPVRRWNAAAQPLRFLDFLIEQPLGSAAVDGGATWVNVPQPARFAVHKLLIASRRSAAEHTRTNKDRLQAAEVLDVLVDARPGEIERALEDLNVLSPRVVGPLRASAAQLVDGPGKALVQARLSP